MNRLLRLLTISFLLVGLHATAQDQAERLFDNAATFMNAGKYKEALADLESVIANHADTPWASQALLSIGRYYLETEGDYPKALEQFARIQNEYAESEAAPAAYYFKALIIEQTGESVADLESAVADLIRMRNLFPENPWESGALFLFGKLALRLGDYPQAQRHFQDLEFNFPKAPFLAKALEHSAHAAFLNGDAPQAARILARLQGLFPNSLEAEKAAWLLRLLDRFARGDVLQLDRSFFGSSPKSYDDPDAVLITTAGMVGVVDSKGVHLAPLEDYAQKRFLSMRDVVDLGADRDGLMLLVLDNRVLREGGEAYLPSLSVSGESLRDIRSAAVDDFGRLLVADDDVRDVLVFGRDGRLIHRFGLSRPQLVRSYAGEAWIAVGGSILRFGPDFANLEGGVSGLSDISDMRFDPYGNLYVLSDRGVTVTIYRRDGQIHQQINLKNGAYPLKAAQSLAVDPSGAIYLSDRRGGSVYRLN